MVERRAQLVEAAWAAYSRTGMLDVVAIAREAGASKALLFHHFGNVEGLRDAMAERVLRETQGGLTAIADDHGVPRERLDALTRALLAEPPEPPAVARHVVSFWLAADANGVPRGALRDALVGDFVEKTLKEMRSHADARAVASLLLARWHGATVLYACGSYVDLDAETDRTLRALDDLLRA